MNTRLRGLEEGSYQADLDAKEKKLNFMLHLDLRPYCGVDITHNIVSDAPKDEVAKMAPAEDSKVQEWDESRTAVLRDGVET